MIIDEEKYFISKPILLIVWYIRYYKETYNLKNGIDVYSLSKIFLSVVEMLSSKVWQN